MSTRIRSIKPAWLDDVKTAEASLAARVLSIALLVMSDDYGNGRLSRAVYARVFPENPKLFGPAFDELVKKGYVRSYSLDGQDYFHVVNWDKHQRVDKPGKPGVPSPKEAESNGSREHQEVSRVSRETDRKVPVTLAPDMEGKGKEGKGKGVDVGASLESPPAPVPKTSRRGTRIPDDFGVSSAP